VRCERLASEIAEWERDWMFTTDKVRAKMSGAYPEIVNESEPL